MTNQMTNQKELSVRQIKNMLRDAEVSTGELLKKTDKQIILLLENEQTKSEIYHAFAVYSKFRKSCAELKRLQLKISKMTA